MKKIASLLVVSIFVVSGAGFASVISPDISTTTDGTTQETMVEQMFTASAHFAVPDLVTRGDYTTVKTTGAAGMLRAQTAPMLPYQVETWTLPVGTKIVDVNVDYSQPLTVNVPGKISPAPTATAYNMKDAAVELREGAVYATDALYPASWHDWHVGVGLDGTESVFYLTVTLYPARYNPVAAILQYVEDMDITVTYERGPAPQQTDTYDMLIITPADFTDALQPLITHKEGYGVSTQVVTLSEVYSGTYFDAQGRDQAEQLKYFIKDALEDWGITYVMLVGGRNGGLFEEQWWCPVRYTHLDDNSNWEKSYTSDLYFADIYKYEEGQPVFDDWDSNGDGVFAQWSMMKRDHLDFYPDVYIGRLPARNNYEVQLMVEKIITYETTAYGSEWANKFLGIGGDTFPYPSDDYLEGELGVTVAGEYLAELGIEPTYLFTSDGTLTGPNSVISTLNQGYGFLNFEGHGNPMGWSTHPPGDDSIWIDGLAVQDMRQLSNDGMYPICMVGGCHNSQFNVTVLNLMKFWEMSFPIQDSIWYSYIYKGEMSPESWSWWLTRKAGGGAIATVGNTGLGYGAIGDYNDDGIPDSNQFYGGRIDSELFRAYAQQGQDTVGAMHGTALTNYIQAFPPMDDEIDAKTVQEWVLLGDPSLKVGGYPS